MQAPQYTNQITQPYGVPMYVNPYGMRRLDPRFQPGTFDVLCARGKVAYQHEGNKRFRELVKRHQKQYSAANCKYEKSKIVSFIVNTVRKASPHGGFVKHIDGQWFEVGDRHAKEKVGQTFRDLLHTKYSSSTKAKARARLERRIQGQEDGNTTETTTTLSSGGQKKRTEPVPSGSAGEVRSSVSVVSSGSVDVDVDSDAITVVKSNAGGLPPLKSVTVEKDRPDAAYSHPGQAFLPEVSPQSKRATKVRLMESLEHLAPPSMAMASVGDLEPLPLGASVKVNLNDSTGTIQSEQTFEDVMSEFCQNMGVAV